MTNEIDLTLRSILYEAGIRFSNQPILSHSLKFYYAGHIFDLDEKLCDENIRYFTGNKDIKEYLDEFFDYSFNYEQVTPDMFNRIDIGGNVNIIYSRFGLNNGKSLRCIGITYNFFLHEIVLRLWG